MYDFTQLTTSELKEAQATISKLLETRQNEDRRKAAFAVVEALDNYMANWEDIICTVRNDFSAFVPDNYGDREQRIASLLDEIRYVDYAVAPDGTLELKLDVE